MRIRELINKKKEVIRTIVDKDLKYRVNKMCRDKK